MNSAAFIVDGHQEKKFLQKVCPGKTVRILNLNGNSVTSTAIAKRVASLCRLFHGKYYPIVMWVDREDREATATEFAAELEAAIRAEGVTDNIVLGVADRAIENWIFADRETVRPHCRDDAPYPKQPDGFNGKGKMKKLLAGYHETTIGVSLLKSCHASRMMMTSLSFKNFCEQLPENDCWWLAR